MLSVKNLSFSYHKNPVLKDISFSAKQGENIAIIGESGSGKSTLLKLLYGEYDLDNGELFWNNQQILGPAYNLVIGYDFMKYVAQEFDLMPFTSVENNVGKFLSNFFPEEKAKRTQELIKVVQLEAFAKTKVKYLSGGQKQRVALARALAKQPEILLLDEPFSHIDNFKKQALRRNVFNYLKANNITCIVATHHKDDVLGFADKVLVLHNKKIAANNTPIELYNNPKTALVASFFGEHSYIEPYGFVYAHQLKISKNTELNAVVKQSYYNGNNWLIEAVYNEKSIFINHNSELKKGVTINFKVEK